MVVEVIGTLAVLAQTVRLVPQIVKGFRTRHVRDISLGWEVLGMAAASLWLTYGLLRRDLALIVGTAITLASFLCLLVQKVLYR